MDNQSLSQEAFKELMKACPAAPDEPLVVAVSGGPDSMALAFLLKRYAPQGREVHGLIVEHGLREESAREAQMCAANLKAMGLIPHVMPWRHGPVPSRVHVRARIARYNLLLEGCREIGASRLYLAHHGNDQAETILMRFAKGSGVNGLAGMSPVQKLQDVTLYRPLLGVAKEQLIATCRDHNVPFFEDPSNGKAKYARGRLRSVMPLLEAEGFSLERLLDLGARARDAKEALGFYTRIFLQQSVEVLEGGAFRMELAALRGTPRAVGLRALGEILNMLHPSDYQPERKQLLPLWQMLTDQDGGVVSSLQGCLIQKGEECGRAVFLREFGAMSEDIPLPDSAGTFLWDGRWKIRFVPEAGQSLPKGLQVRALGFQPHDVIDPLAPDLRARIPRGRVRATLPALWVGDVLHGLPSFSVEDQAVVTATLLPVSWV